MATKSNPGKFFEDFKLGQVIRHATPRTITVAVAEAISAMATA